MKNIFEILDDDEINQIHESTLSTIAELNERGPERAITCIDGEHHICINDYCEYQCYVCFIFFSLTAVKEELARSVFWSNDPHQRYAELKELRSLVDRNKAPKQSKIEVSGYRYMGNGGYTAIDKIFYEPI